MTVYLLAPTVSRVAPDELSAQVRARFGSELRRSGSFAQLCMLGAQACLDAAGGDGPLAVLWSAFTGGVPVALVYKPGGTLSGQRTYTFNANITSLAEPAEVGGLVTFSSDWETTGAVTPTTQ